MTEPSLRRIVQARAGGRVERLHIIPHRQGYTNAAHSWGVALLMMHLWPEDFPRLAGVCITHDVPEHWTGDSPSPVFTQVPFMREGFDALHHRISRTLGHTSELDLLEGDHAKLKACDLLEFYMWAREEMNTGNMLVAEHVLKIEERVAAGIILLPYPADIVFEAMHKDDLIPNWHDFLEEHGRGAVED